MWYADLYFEENGVLTPYPSPFPPGCETDETFSSNFLRANKTNEEIFFFIGLLGMHFFKKIRQIMTFLQKAIDKSIA